MMSLAFIARYQLTYSQLAVSSSGGCYAAQFLQTLEVGS